MKKKRDVEKTKKKRQKRQIKTNTHSKMVCACENIVINVQKRNGNKQNK